VIEIVKAEERHVKDIGALWWEFITFHRDIDPVWEPEDDAVGYFIEGLLRPYLESEDSLVLVAVDGTETVGYALAKITRVPPGMKRDDYGYIEHVAVTERRRREGIGERLYEETMAWFHSHGIRRVEVSTAAGNGVADAFWRRQGFAVSSYTLFKEDPTP
jgi:GNAT superfamily N-acetyltransferase